jgi:addiction module RelE/StbE family toxin
LEPARYRILLTQQALADIEEIHAYIAERSETAAASMIERILDAIDSLEVFPHRNVVKRRSSKMAEPVRSLPVRPYVIFFRVVDQHHVVVIRHIRHGARRRPKRLD